MADDLFSSFDRQPVGPLASADVVRARGDQRRRRARAALAGGGTLAVALAFTGGYALFSGEGGRDSVRPAPVAGGTSPSPEPTYDSDGCLVQQAPSGRVCLTSPRPSPAGSSPAPSPLPSRAPSPSASPSPSAAPDGLDADDYVALENIGPVEFGMTVDEASEAAGQRIVVNQMPDFVNEDGSYCAFATPESGSPEVAFMVNSDVVGRVDVSRGSPTRTRSGMGIGSTIEQVQQTYGDRLVVEPHPYRPDDRYLRYASSDDTHLLIFETSEGVVDSFRAGLSEAVEAIEGCA